MARNSEKAQSMLFRFREAQAADLGIIDAGRARRPRVISEVDAIPMCEKWRGQVLKEISRKVSRIQEPALSDFQLRDLNDEINRLMREKHAWESQIRHLGGPNYARAARLYDDDGREIAAGSVGARGYKYFGRARDLPGVKELFDAAAARAQEQRDRATRGDHSAYPADPAAVRWRRAHVNAAYYGFGTGAEDEEMLAYEAAREAEARARLLASDDGLEPPPGWEPLPGDAGDGQVWVLPTLEEAQQELIERKRRRLLEQL